MKPKQNPHFSPDHLCDQEYNELPGREGLRGGEGLGTPPALASGRDGQVGPHTLRSPGVSFSLLAVQGV